MARKISKDAFLLFSNRARPPEILGEAVLVEDGHPSICPVDHQLLLTDTYEDPENYRHLILYDLRSNEAIELGKFYSPPKFNQSGFRCDLHPRWSPSGKMICVDMVRGSRRQMLVIDVSPVLDRICASGKSRIVGGTA